MAEDLLNKFGAGRPLVFYVNGKKVGYVYYYFWTLEQPRNILNVDQCPIQLNLIPQTLMQSNLNLESQLS